MQPLTEEQVRAALVNAAPDELQRLALPLDFVAVVEVAQVDQELVFEQLAHAGEIERAEGVPFGGDDRRAGAFEGFVGVAAVGHPFEQLGRLLHSLGVVSAHPDPRVLQRLVEGEAEDFILDLFERAVRGEALPRKVVGKSPQMEHIPTTKNRSTFGVVEVTRNGDVSSALVTSSDFEARAGDYVLPIDDKPYDSEYLPHAPSKVPDNMRVIAFSGLKGETHWVHMEIFEGSYGGRYGRDGIDAVDTLYANTRNNPVEDVESHLPLRVTRYELRESAVAAGQWRGGMGSVREFVYLSDGGASVEGDGHKYRPWGFAGGQDGEPERPRL